MVWNRTAEKTVPLVERGAEAAPSPGEAAARAAIVITFLADDNALEEVALGPEGIAARLGPGGVHLFFDERDLAGIGAPAGRGASGAGRRRRRGPGLRSARCRRGRPGVDRDLRRCRGEGKGPPDPGGAGPRRTRPWRGPGRRAHRQARREFPDRRGDRGHGGGLYPGREVRPRPGAARRVLRRQPVPLAHLPALVPGGDRRQAETRLHQAIEISRQQAARIFELRAATSLARIWADQGDGEKAYQLLAPIYGGFTEGFDTADLKDAETLLKNCGSASSSGLLAHPRGFANSASGGAPRGPSLHRQYRANRRHFQRLAMGFGGAFLDVIPKTSSPAETTRTRSVGEPLAPAWLPIHVLATNQGLSALN
jgi:NAD binding domain of 6-phosphogluconate dehydrogenase